MKKILLATTVLSMTAGFAAADVSVSGDARMGVVSTDGDSVFSSRMRIKFSGSGTTDGGLSFGGSFRANDAAGAKAGTAGSVFISGAFGKISMGDVDSGDAAAVGQLASVGYTGLGSTNSINYAADGFDLFGLPAELKGSDSYYFDSEYVELTPEQIADGADIAYVNTYSYSTEVDGGAPAKVLYTYSAGGVTVNASAGQIANGSDHTSYGLGAAYTTGGLTVAVGYGSNEFSFVTEGDFSNSEDFYWGYWETSSPYWKDTVSDGSVTDSSMSVTYVMGDTTIKAIYQDKQIDATYQSEWWDYSNRSWYTEYAAVDVSAEATSMGLSVVHKIGALTLTAFDVNTDLSSKGLLGEKDISVTRMGLGASYDLGGGASVAGGVARVEAAALDGDWELASKASNVYDLGVNFSF